MIPKLCIKHYALGILLLAVLFGCTTEAERRKMRAGLDSINVLNRTDQPFTPDDVRPYIDFFDKEAKAFFTLLSSDSLHNDQLLAHYLLGRAYHEKGDAPMALESYQHAIDHADTTSASCDYYTLMATYGQMSILFHQQNLPQDEIWALQYYIKYIQHQGDSLDYIISKGQLLRPYYLLNEKDSVLSIINDTYRQLKQLGHTKEAAAGKAERVCPPRAKRCCPPKLFILTPLKS